MSIRGRIEEARPSQSGKTLGVKINGQWYSTKHFELQNMVGNTISGDTSTSEFNGKTMHWLNDWSEAPPSADDQFQAAYAQANQPQQAPQQAPQAAPVAPQAPQTNREASIVAQALTKACTAPGDDVQKVWDRYQAFYNLAMGKGPIVKKIPVAPQASSDFDDDIPFN